MQLPKRPAGEPRPALSAEANLAFMFHHALGTEPFGDIIRDVTGSGIETPWESRPWHPTQTLRMLNETKAYANESAEAFEQRLKEQVVPSRDRAKGTEVVVWRAAESTAVRARQLLPVL